MSCSWSQSLIFSPELELESSFLGPESNSRVLLSVLTLESELETRTKNKDSASLVPGKAEIL